MPRRTEQLSCVIAFCLLIGTLWSGGLTSLSQAEEPLPQSAPAPALILEDREEGMTQIVIPSQAGLVEWDEIAAVLADVIRLDPQSAREMVPSGTVDLHKASTRLALFALNRALSPGLKFGIDRRESPEAPQLLLSINKAELQKTRRKIKGKIRKIIGQDEDQNYGLTLDEDWKSFPKDHPVVVLIHGFQSERNRLGELRLQVRQERCPVAMFTFPNDQEITASAELLALELQELRKTVRQRPLVVLALSMGGLVAREALENPEYKAPTAQRLILVCTPNHGSTWATISLGVDLWEHLVKHPQWNVLASARAGVADGLGEASSDLKPGSPFLKQLNSRKLCPETHYTLVLGTGGKLDAEQLSAMKTTLEQLSGKYELVQLVQPRLEAALNDFDEVLEGKGDGVVSLERGRLEGVDDLLVLPVTHHEVLHEFETPAGKQLWDFLLDRMELPEEKPEIP